MRDELRALCVGRHEILSDHLRRFFGRFDLETSCAVGIEGAAVAARAARPDVVICDYDLLATMSLDSWERDEHLSRTPVIAVSMTRRPDELHPLDVNGIGGFLYLPRLGRAEALAALRTVTAASPVASAIRSAVPSPMHHADAAPLSGAPYTLGGVLDWPPAPAAGVSAAAAKLPAASARDEASAR